MQRLASSAIAAAIALVPSVGLAQERPAAPVGSITDWFGPENYPTEALSASEQGRSVVVVRIDALGKPTACTIKESSGSSALDDGTCAILMRGVFNPALDRQGKPIASEYLAPVRWTLPSGADGLFLGPSFVPVASGSSIIEQVVNADGRRRTCVARMNGKEAPNSAQACEVGAHEVEEVLGKVPADFRGHPLVIYSASFQSYSNAPTPARLDDTDATVVGRITIRFAIGADGQVSNCRVDGTSNVQAWLATMPCRGLPPFRKPFGRPLTEAVEGTWTMIQAAKVLPKGEGI